MPVKEDDFGTQLLQNAFELWFNPEAKRRLDEGRMVDGTPIFAAQVVMDVTGGGTQVRFNDEVRGVAQIKAKRSIKAGEPVLASDIDKIIRTDLTEEDPNSAHLTAIHCGGRWFISFDFRYNATLIKEHLRVAKQFLAVANWGFNEGYLNAAVENLFACVELVAKSILLLSPDRRVIKSRKHNFIKTRFNLEYGRQFEVAEAVKLFNSLSELRPLARYRFVDHRLDNDEIAGMLRTAREMLDQAEAQAPRRASTKIED